MIFAYVFKIPVGPIEGIHEPEVVFPHPLMGFNGIVELFVEVVICCVFIIKIFQGAIPGEHIIFASFPVLVIIRLKITLDKLIEFFTPEFYLLLIRNRGSGTYSHAVYFPPVR